MRLVIALLGWLLGLPSLVHAASLSLSGADWFIRDAAVEEGDWIPARVPGNVQADLETAGRLGPVWPGAGDPRLAEVAKKDWWYRKTFVAPAAYQGKRLQLVFEGVDFEFEAWLNGARLGARSGQFRRHRFEVSRILKSGEQNELKVRIKRMPPQLEHCFASSDGARSGVGTADFFVD